jgi:flagellar biosynthesis regulator FlaF
MSGYREINKAYQSAVSLRPQRDRDADVFDIVRSRLQEAQQNGNLALVKAFADNARLWHTVINANLDDSNPQEQKIRASLVSLGYAVVREMKESSPNIGFLIEVNNNIAAGLRGVPPLSD